MPGRTDWSTTKTAAIAMTNFHNDLKGFILPLRKDRLTQVYLPAANRVTSGRTSRSGWPPGLTNRSRLFGCQLLPMARTCRLGEFDEVGLETCWGNYLPKVELGSIQHSWTYAFAPWATSRNSLATRPARDISIKPSTPIEERVTKDKCPDFTSSAQP